MSTDDIVPNRPISFGYKNHWLAISKAEPRDVAEALDLQQVGPSTWREGVDRSHAVESSDWQVVFVSPPLQGWTLVVGGSSAIPQAGNNNWFPFLCDLSARFGIVQYFGNHRVVGYVAWAKAVNGALIRAFGYSGESGETLIEYGDITREEEELGIDLLNEKSATDEEAEAHRSRVDDNQAKIFAFQEQHPEGAQSESELREIDSLIRKASCLSPDEETVLLVADKWSINPILLDDYGHASPLGQLGSIRRGRWLDGA
jgi:hypothetical protein